MESHEIAPAPVNNIDDLLAKLDLIVAAVKQYLISNDYDLARIVAYRYKELDDEIINIVGSPEQWTVVDQKLQSINSLLLHKRNNDFHSMCSLN